MSDGLKGNNITINTGNTILSQYQIAVDLYKHEDSLNWTKLSYLLYANAGLLAVIGFVCGEGTGLFRMNITNNLLMFFICLVGAFGSKLYGKTLDAGITYLQNRKKTIINLEKLLIENHNGGHLFYIPDTGEQAEENSYSGLIDKDKKDLNESPTTKVLKKIPVIFFIIWVLFAVVIALTIVLSFFFL